MFKTTNGGNIWNGANNGLTDFFVRALAIDPSNPSILYAGTRNGGVHKSTNGGNNWIDSSNGIGTRPVNKLVIDYSDPDTLYAGTDSLGVFKTTDGGNNWIEVNNGLTELERLDWRRRCCMKWICSIWGRLLWWRWG